MLRDTSIGYQVAVVGRCTKSTRVQVDSSSGLFITPIFKVSFALVFLCMKLSLSSVNSMDSSSIGIAAIL